MNETGILYVQNVQNFLGISKKLIPKYSLDVLADFFLMVH